MIDLESSDKSAFVPFEELELTILRGLCKNSSRIIEIIEATRKKAKCDNDIIYQVKNGMISCIGTKCPLQEKLPPCEIMSSSTNGFKISGNYEASWGCKKQPTNPVLGAYFVYAFIQDNLLGNLMNFEDTTTNLGAEALATAKKCDPSTVQGDVTKSKACLNTTISSDCITKLNASFRSYGLDTLYFNQPVDVNSIWLTKCNKDSEGGFRYNGCLQALMQYFFENTMSLNFTSFEMASVIIQQSNLGCISKEDFLTGKVTETKAGCMYKGVSLAKSLRYLTTAETFTFDDKSVALFSDLGSLSTSTDASQFVILGSTPYQAVIINFINIIDMLF